MLHVTIVDATRSSPPSAPAAVTAPERQRSPAVWCFRALLAVPFACMAPLVASAVAGTPGAVEKISAATADVLGTSSLLAFFLMLTVTPVRTMTGWRWHVVLRRDFGIGMFVIALADLILAAITTGDTFHGGLLSRVAGRALLAAGTAAVLLSVPLVLTANRRAQRWLGPHWKRLHRLTYLVWALILLHLLLLFGLRTFFLDALLLSFPLVVLRLPTVRGWWVAVRHAGRRRLIRTAASVLLGSVYLAGLIPFLRELATVGAAAFSGHPIVD